jgi:hypothetical protein
MQAWKLMQLTAAVSFALAGGPAFAEGDVPGTQPKKQGYSPYPEVTYPNRVYVGDTHLHTSYSADAGMVGNTVNVAEASYTNSIGAPYLATYWKDSGFDAKQRACYYVRVLEIPPPRWTTYDAKVFKLALPKDVPASIQERAYTPPIWYTP